MLLADFCELNEKKIQNGEKELLPILEKLFGTPKVSPSRKGTEYNFGRIYGRVVECLDNDMMVVELLDKSLAEPKWDDKLILLKRKNRSKLDVGQYCTHTLFYEEGDVFTRAMKPYTPKTAQIDTADLDTDRADLKIDTNATAGATDTNAASTKASTGADAEPLAASLQTLKEKLDAQGYRCNISVLAQFLLAMKTNQLIILHGAPGMGKTSFVTHVAHALQANYKIIPVRPNWIDNQDLTGYFNPVEHRYYSTPFLDALCEAKENPDVAYFICLDEMNLAHVEYYLSDVLSAMESGAPIPLYSEADQKNALDRLDCILEHAKKHSVEWLDATTDRKNLACRYTAQFSLPENVVFIGTLNMDDTTNDLSPKVIDRSCIIKVTKDTGQTLRTPSEGALPSSESEQKSTSSFEYQLLCALNKQVSRRVEQQKARMNTRRDSLYLREQISDADFQDMYMATKVLPALRAEDVDGTSSENELVINGFQIEGGKTNYETLYPLTVSSLKAMYVPEEQVLNYWRQA